MLSNWLWETQQRFSWQPLASGYHFSGIRFFIIDSLASEHEISEASAEADSLESLIHWLHALIGFISFMFQETMMSAAEAAGREAAQSAALADPEKLPPEANEAPEEEALEEDQVVEEAASEDSKEIS